MDFVDDDNSDMMEPEYDMEFTAYGPNVIQVPMSPPNTPPLDAQQLAPVRVPSPFSSDTSMTSVDSNDSLGYYREEAGRMFAAMPDVPVVMPVDHAEIRRVSGQHELLKLVCGGNYMGPVEELLSPENPRTLRVLDVISNSPWVDEMAEDFPHVKFHGCNFVPTRHPHFDNVVFEVYNLNDGFRGKDASFDLIHARGTFKMTKNYRAWLEEFKRLLRPGGLLIVCDLEMALWMRDGSDSRISLPAMMGYVDCVNTSLYSQGIPIGDMPLVGTWLREMGGFEDVDDTVTSIPVGDWESDELQRDIGEMSRDNIMSVLYSVHPLYRRQGKTQEEVDRLSQEARVELYEKNLQTFERMFYCVARRSADG